MAFGVTYRCDFLQAMQELVAGAAGQPRPEKVHLIGKTYTGTKVRAFKTFGVTALLKIGGRFYTGTGVAPVATSSGVREPQSVSPAMAQEHLKQLEQELHDPQVHALDPFAVEAKLLDLDARLAQQRQLSAPRPTSGIGSQVAIATTVALLEAQAAYYQVPMALAMRAILLHLQGKKPNVDDLMTPLPKFNILNFGKHSATKRDDGLPYVWLQETKIVPVWAQDFEEAVDLGVQVLNKLIEIVGVDNIGFEAGISPHLTSPEEVYEKALQAIKQAGCEDKVLLATDAAASEFAAPETPGSENYLYSLYPGKKPLNTDEMVDFWVQLVKKYKGQLISIEDGMHSEDIVGWRKLKQALGEEVELQGDDLFVTDPQEEKRLADCANSILIKPNQAGTILRTLQAIATARELGFTISPSHRSGKVPGGYGIIPELCLGTQAEWIKPGAPRRERAGFVNNVISIASSLEILLGTKLKYAGPEVARKFGLCSRDSQDKSGSADS